MQLLLPAVHGGLQALPRQEVTKVTHQGPELSFADLFNSGDCVQKGVRCCASSSSICTQEHSIVSSDTRRCYWSTC